MYYTPLMFQGVCVCFFFEFPFNLYVSPVRHAQCPREPHFLLLLLLLLIIVIINYYPKCLISTRKPWYGTPAQAATGLQPLFIIV